MSLLVLADADAADADAAGAAPFLVKEGGREEETNSHADVSQR